MSYLYPRAHDAMVNLHFSKKKKLFQKKKSLNTSNPKFENEKWPYRYGRFPENFVFSLTQLNRAKNGNVFLQKKYIYI